MFASGCSRTLSARDVARVLSHIIVMGAGIVLGNGATAVSGRAASGRARLRPSPGITPGPGLPAAAAGRCVMPGLGRSLALPGYGPEATGGAPGPGVRPGLGRSLALPGYGPAATGGAPGAGRQARGTGPRRPARGPRVQRKPGRSRAAQPQEVVGPSLAHLLSLRDPDNTLSGPTGSHRAQVKMRHNRRRGRNRMTPEDETARFAGRSRVDRTGAANYRRRPRGMRSCASAVQGRKAG